jgi:hypothetical protein
LGVFIAGWPTQESFAMVAVAHKPKELRVHWLMTLPEVSHVVAIGLLVALPKLMAEKFTALDRATLSPQLRKSPKGPGRPAGWSR